MNYRYFIFEEDDLDDLLYRTDDNLKNIMFLMEYDNGWEWEESGYNNDGAMSSIQDDCREITEEDALLEML